MAAFNQEQQNMKSRNNANITDDNIRQQSSPKAGWITMSVGREHKLLYRKLRRSY